MSAVARTYGRLDAFVRTLEGMSDDRVQQRYVDEYHSVIDQVEAEGAKLDEFRVGPNDLRHREYVRSYMGGGQTRNSLEKFVDRNLLVLKARGLLSYFTLLTETPPRQVGFRPPD